MKKITISEQVIEVLDYLGEKFGIVVDWNAKNTLPYVKTLCEKYINWEIATSVLTIVFLIIGMIILAKSFKYGNDSINGNTTFDEDAGWILMFVSAVLLLASIGLTIAEVFDLAKCITFPELKIYEYIMELIKNM